MSMRLYFGPSLRYFFDDGKGNFRYRAPAAFVDFFKNENVKEIHNMAFGIGDSFFLCYTRADGQIRHYFQHDNHYLPLKEWIFDKDLKHGSSLYVSLGLNDSFFAASIQGYRWRNIPDDLLDFFLDHTTTTLFLTQRIHTADLGYNNTFFGGQVNGGWFWDLGKEYPHFEALDIKKRITQAEWAVINPYAPDQHFVVFQDGTTHFSLPPEWAPDMAQLFQQYAYQTSAGVSSQSAGTTAPANDIAAVLARITAERQQSLDYTLARMSISRPAIVQYPPLPQYAPQPQYPLPQQQQPAPSKPFWRRSSSSSSHNNPPRPSPSVQPNSTPPWPDPDPGPWQSPPQQPSTSPPARPYGIPPPQYQQYAAKPEPHTSTLNEAMHLANNAFDTYNNVTNAGTGGGSPVDVNQAIGWMQSSVDTINTAANLGNQGVNLVSQVTNAGVMVGQVAATAAACNVM